MNRPQDVLALRVAVLVAVVASCAAALGEGAGNGLLWLATLVGFPVAFAIGYLVRATRPLPLRIAQSVVALLILTDFVARLDHVTDLAALQIPLAQAFIFLLLLHALDTPNRRGLMVLLVSSLVLVALAGVLSISMAVAPWLAVWALAALTALVLGYRAELSELPALDRSPPTRFRPGQLLVPIAVLLVVLAVGAAVFMLVPVAGTNRALTFPAQFPDDTPLRSNGGLSNPSLGAGDPAADSDPDSGRGSRASFGYFGFSDRLDTSLRGRPDDTLVMRVRASAPDFWRGQTFDTWDGRVWTVADDEPRSIRGDQPIGIPRVAADGPVSLATDVDELVQTYYLETVGPNSILGANRVTKVYFPERTIFQNRDGTLRAGVRLDPGTVYTVVSERQLITEDALRRPPLEPVPPDITAQYATRPVTTERVRALAHRITAGAPTTYDKVRAVEDHLSRTTQYSLDIPRLPRGADAVDQYLFVDRKGFCEQIGTTLVVMLRELGIPARLVVGYTPGERNPFTGLYEVKASDAHAWAEVYFPGVGWQGFDPTAQVPLAGDSGIDSAGAGALDYLSARLDIPKEALVALVVLAGIAGFVLALRSVSRRPRRPAVSRSWASRQLARLESAGGRRGRPRAPCESTPTYVRSLVTLAPRRSDDLERIGDALDAAMFAPDDLARERRDEIDALVGEVTREFGHRTDGADLVPTR